MFERIIEIIVYVVSEMRHHKSISDIDVDELLKKGYTDTEISIAFSWLTEKISESSEKLNKNKNQQEKSFRILHSAEQEMFTKESWGELLQYHSLGIIDNSNIEKIIERAMMFGGNKIDSRQLKSFIARIVFYPHPDKSQVNRIMLNGDDIIN